MIKLLVAIPCLYGQEHTDKAIASVLQADVLLIDNGAERSVKEVLNKYSILDNVVLIHNKENMYVNYALQQAIDYFLIHPEYSHLALMNSDLIMYKSWYDVLEDRLNISPNEILIPFLDNDISNKDISFEEASSQVVTEGTAGVFMLLNRQQTKIISPIPHEHIKVWFGDNWIYEILRGVGYTTVIPKNLIAFHYGSQNVQHVANIHEIIEEDKRQWKNIVQDKIIEIINKHKT